eukprot:4771410-Pyramimonas_sp.AAC.1
MNSTIPRVQLEAPDGLPVPALLDVAELPSVRRPRGAGPLVAQLAQYWGAEGAQSEAGAHLRDHPRP